MKILFQEPFVPRNITFGKFSKAAGNNTFPYGIACIASYIKERGYNVSYIDPNIENMSCQDYVNYIKVNNFDLIGIGSTTLQIEYATATFQIIKENFPDVITVLGGVHATLMPIETVNYTNAIDYLILGEGEKPFYQLIECLKHNRKDLIESIEGICFKANDIIVLKSPVNSNRLESDEIPIPLFEIFPMRKYIPQISYAKVFPSHSIVASRGCPFRCAFCNASDILGRRVRYKPVDDLLQEIRILKDRYGSKGIMFLDSTFTVNKHWLIEFCSKYVDSNLNLPWACNSRVDTINKDLLLLMKEAGCWSILFGIESANQKSLDLLDKGTNVEQNVYAIQLSLELGFYVYTSYIICLPGENEDDVLNTITFARKMGNQLSMFYLPVPFPKTKLWEICKEMGELREDANWVDFNSWDFSNPVYINPLIGKVKMQALYKKAYLSFYSNPVVCYRNLKEIIFLRQSIFRYWLAFKGFLSLISTKVDSSPV